MCTGAKPQRNPVIVKLRSHIKAEALAVCEILEASNHRESEERFAQLRRTIGDFETAHQEALIQFGVTQSVTT